MSSIDLKKIDSLHKSLANAHDRALLKIIVDRKYWNGDIIKIAINFLVETSGFSKSSVLRSMKRIRNGVYPLLLLVQKHSARMEVSAVYRFNHLNLDRMVEQSKILKAKDRENAWILSQQSINCENVIEQPVNKPLLGVRETPTTGVRETPSILVPCIKRNTVGIFNPVDNLEEPIEPIPIESVIDPHLKPKIRVRKPFSKIVDNMSHLNLKELEHLLKTPLERRAGKPMYPKSVDLETAREAFMIKCFEAGIVNPPLPNWRSKTLPDRIAA